MFDHGKTKTVTWIDERGNRRYEKSYASFYNEKNELFHVVSRAIGRYDIEPPYAIIADEKCERVTQNM